jgi:hypothetical protein
VRQTAKALRATWHAYYTRNLDFIFAECASNEIVMGPDEALYLMEDGTERLAKTLLQIERDKDAPDSDSPVRFDFDAFRREAHHYAVDCFYRTYFPRKRGTPPLPIHYLDRILQLSRKGMNVAQIAGLLNQRKNTIDKQLAIAEKRWRETVGRIELIRQRSSHLVGTVEQPIPKLKKQSKSNRSTRKPPAHTGK